MEQLQSDNPLEVDITRIIEAPTTTRTTEEDMTSSYIVAAFFSGDGSRLSPSSSFRADQYMLVRLSKAGDANVLKTLGKNLGE